jgi:hypothetical protein
MEPNVKSLDRSGDLCLMIIMNYLLSITLIDNCGKHLIVQSGVYDGKIRKFASGGGKPML